MAEWLIRGRPSEPCRSWDGGDARAFCERMALVKSDELLELSRRQSAAKPYMRVRKVQRLGGVQRTVRNTPLASDTI